MKVDQGSFRPSVFIVNGGVRGECTVFYSLSSSFFEEWDFVYVDPI